MPLFLITQMNYFKQGSNESSIMKRQNLRIFVSQLLSYTRKLMEMSGKDRDN